ncbi:TM2 domain-containing protein [Persicobacter psychrovividus]
MITRSDVLSSRENNLNSRDGCLKIGGNYNQNKNSVVMGYLFLLIIFSAHYAYNGKWGMQILFWLTAGGLGVWWLIDIFRMSSIIKKYNDKQLANAIISVKAYSH